MAMPRFEHGVAFVGEQLLVFGGFDIVYNCLAEVSRVLYKIARAAVRRWRLGTRRQRDGSSPIWNWKLAGLNLERSLFTPIQSYVAVLKS